ncbi:hypothetical protein AB0J40_03295 [Amycolatopsis sp. NPDC049691]|uniref:hypothetical protein n=1 Tax=Amycolatopsis sp. NPDC049691 TaxID=3155155 RepID=UPI003416233E
MPKSSRSTSRASRSRTLVEVGGAAVVSLGSAAGLVAWINGEPVTVAVLSSGAAIAALLNALVAVAAFLAGPSGDDVASDQSRGREIGMNDDRKGEAEPD